MKKVGLCIVREIWRKTGFCNLYVIFFCFRPYLPVLPRRPFAPKSVADLNLGDLVKFSRPGGKISNGTIQYKGHLPGREEMYLGVELQGDELGKHDGIFQGTRYFLW